MMLTRLLNWWEALRSSYWFVPGLMASSAFVAAELTLWLDETAITGGFWTGSWFYRAGAEGARAVLATVAGAMITIAGLTFSLTMVALVMASAQFGPYLLGNFRRDLANQLTFGMFVSTFLYSLLILKSVRGVEGSELVPAVSITVAMALAVGSMVLLIYFVHHVSRSIQASAVVEGVSGELQASLHRNFPQREGVAEESAAPPLPMTVTPGLARASGYVRTIDLGAMEEIANETKSGVRVCFRPGEFVVKGEALIETTASGPDARAEDLAGCVTLGSSRTMTQDVEFGVVQLVQIALRALSPALNDPKTATLCIDRLGEFFCSLPDRVIQPPPRSRDAGSVHSPHLSYAGYLVSAFEEILDNCQNMPSVRNHLAMTLQRILRLTSNAAQRVELEAFLLKVKHRQPADC